MHDRSIELHVTKICQDTAFPPPFPPKKTRTNTSGTTMRSLSSSSRIPPTTTSTRSELVDDDFSKPNNTCGFYYVLSESDQFVGGLPTAPVSLSSRIHDSQRTRANDPSMMHEPTGGFVGINITTAEVSSTVSRSVGGGCIQIQSPKLSAVISTQPQDQHEHEEHKQTQTHHQQQKQHRSKDKAKNNASCVARNRCRRTRTARKIQFRKERQSYDMNRVPRVKANPFFLTVWRNLLLSLGGEPPDYAIPSSSNVDSRYNEKRRGGRDSRREQRGDVGHGNVSPGLPCLVPCDGPIRDPPSTSKSPPLPNLYDITNLSHLAPKRHPHHNNNNNNNSQHFNCNYNYNSPFATDFESLLWEPSSRHHWVDSIDEMTALCTTASRKRHLALNKAPHEFSPPLSRAYIKERVDIDDPLQGFQIRHATGGWLQGFIMTTTFTSWTYWFKWDSIDVHSNGMADPGEYDKGRNDDGTLALDLDEQPRSGDPKDSGVVWPTVAEIVLVGALGCGEYLVQLALDRMAQQGYKYVVLEATDASRPFYERFGFVRVGALAKYGTEQQVVGQGVDSRPNAGINPGNVEIQGYSHWAPADMGKDQLKTRGPPSCMMGRRIQGLGSKLTVSPPLPFTYCPCGSGGVQRWPFRGSFGEELARHFIKEKPVIRPLGLPGRSLYLHNQSHQAGNKRALSSIITPTNRESPESKSARYSSDDGRLFGQSGRVRTSVTRSPPPSFDLPNPTIQTPSDAVPTALPIVSRLPKQSSLRQTLSNSLFKQNIANMYRHRKTKYYYNKVVTPIQSNRTLHKSEYYFVLHYNARTQRMHLIPLYIDGTFSKGAQMGKPKWKARVKMRQDGIEEIAYLKSVDVIVDGICNEWEIVKSLMVTKCKSVSSESWFIR